MQNLKYVEFRHRGLLSVSGADAKDFLQSLITNDMDLVDHDSGIYAALLTPQGKYLHDFFICCGGVNIEFVDRADGANATSSKDECHYLVESDRVEDLAKRLQMYKLRAKVDIQVMEDWSVSGLFGSNLVEVLGVRQIAGGVCEFGPQGVGGRLLVDPRAPNIGVRCYVPTSVLAETMGQFGVELGSLADFDQTRICQGMPDGCRDLEPEKATLLENRFDLIGGISWSKGCYVGQEITARMKYRNLGKKQLFVVDLEGPAPQKGTPIMLAGAKVGELKTSVPGVGLALLRLEALEKYQLKGGKLVANATQLYPRIESDESQNSETYAYVT